MPPNKSLNILFADDENEIALIVSGFLARAGHVVDVVGDGKAALAKLKEQPAHYNLLITDSNMPEMSGIDLIRQLPEIGYSGKIILLSGYLTEELQEDYTSLPINRIIQKPFALADLGKIIGEMAG
jgi:CheY-like chemotaxis protein